MEKRIFNIKIKNTQGNTLAMGTVNLLCSILSDANGQEWLNVCKEAGLTLELPIYKHGKAAFAVFKLLPRGENSLRFKMECLLRDETSSIGIKMSSLTLGEEGCDVKNGHKFFISSFSVSLPLFCNQWGDINVADSSKEIYRQIVILGESVKDVAKELGMARLRISKIVTGYGFRKFGEEILGDLTKTGGVYRKPSIGQLRRIEAGFSGGTWSPKMRGATERSKDIYNKVVREHMTYKETSRIYNISTTRVSMVVKREYRRRNNLRRFQSIPHVRKMRELEVDVMSHEHLTKRVDAARVEQEDQCHQDRRPD